MRGAASTAGAQTHPAEFDLSVPDTPVPFSVLSENCSGYMTAQDSYLCGGLPVLRGFCAPDVGSEWDRRSSSIFRRTNPEAAATCSSGSILERIDDQQRELLAASFVRLDRPAV
jgi:hypothetical protein